MASSENIPSRFLNLLQIKPNEFNYCNDTNRMLTWALTFSESQSTPKINKFIVMI